MNRQHAHRIDDRPRISAGDVRALLWLIVFALLFIAITVVEAPR